MENGEKGRSRSPGQGMGGNVKADDPKCFDTGSKRHQPFDAIAGIRKFISTRNLCRNPDILRSLQGVVRADKAGSGEKGIRP